MLASIKFVLFGDVPFVNFGDVIVGEYSRSNVFNESVKSVSYHPFSCLESPRLIIVIVHKSSVPNYIKFRLFFSLLIVSSNNFPYDKNNKKNDFCFCFIKTKHYHLRLSSVAEKLKT